MTFRSLDMSYIQVLLPTTVAEEFADSIGREACIQFTDLNEDVHPFQRPHTKEIVRIQEIGRRIKEIENQLKEYKVPFDQVITPNDLVQHRRQSTVDKIQQDVFKAYQELKNQGKAERDLKKQLSEHQAKVEVLSQMDGFLSLERRQFVEERLGDANKEKGGPNEVAFKYIAGVVTTAQRVSFERQVYLTSRGNSLVRFQEAGGDNMVFAVFFLGNQLQRSLRRLCQFMNILICYESDSEIPREVLLEQARNERSEDKRTHSATRNLLMNLMGEVAKQLKDWKMTLLQEQGIRVTLNRFRSHQGNSVLRAEGWCATNQKEHIQQVLEAAAKDKGVGQGIMTDMLIGNRQPPTFFETTEFTNAFQQIVDTYGVPRYKEFNPAIPTIITFPFLFGVMYGDMFHGSCLLLFALMLFVIARVTDINKTPLATMYFARYLLLFMGGFSVYCGLIYNDCLSIMVNGWNHTQWRHREVDGRLVAVQESVYSVGIDPAWGKVNNQLTFANSLKMKLSVIIGVGQMTFGLFLKLSNHLQEGDYLSVWFEFVPQLVFMVCFFGYMIFLIFYKWCIDWSRSTLPDTPSLITLLIKMFLAPGTIDPSVQIFTNKKGQAQLQLAFLFLMILSIPVMLCVKPCVIKRRMNHAASHELLMDDEHPSSEVQMPSLKEPTEEKHPETAADEEMDGHAHPTEQGHGHSQNDHEESFSDVVIHQLIHTIEYVLGTISNTASYLRLWALSLAHAELSEVFFSKTLRTTIAVSGGTGVVLNVAGTFMFIMFTVGVLLVMDVLECFLHALRLHWVEFQNKFYYGDGRAFEPFSYAKLLEKKL